MSKTTRSSEKARPEILSKRADSVKENKLEKKAPAVSKKQKVNQVSSPPPIKAVQDSGKKKTVHLKTAADGKPTPASIASGPASQITTEDSSAQLLRRTKTTDSALSQLEKGIEFIHRKDFKKAISELQSLIGKFPNEAAIVASARSYIEICRRREAHQKKAPATHSQSYALGVMEHNKTNYDKAIGYFRQSLEKYPNADYIYYSIAASLALKGDVSEAIENLRKAVELNIDSRVHAKNDPDFASLENNREFMELIGVPVSRHV